MGKKIRSTLQEGLDKTDAAGGGDGGGGGLP